ncbi:MAG: endonuclease/exonuclease/phosphatase family protein [Chloroflexi bacterium]|nr:endonuclease/exonuclease/phosphatase family protein [Chloroflexota bacterium]
MPRRAKAVKKDRVSVFAEWLTVRPLLTELTLTALTVLFGMQVLRVLVPGMFWTLGGRMGWGAMELGIIGFLIFLTGFLAGPLGRLAGNRRLIVITAIGLGTMRLFMQVWWGEPLFNLSLAIVGTILFVIFLPACFEDARLHGGPAISRYTLGLLGGLALDIAINGAFGTYDTVWQVEPLPVLLTLLLVIIQLALIVGITPTIKTISAKSHTTKTNGISIARSFTWLAIGPFLFLELVVFQNIPRMAALTGWPLPIDFGLTLLAQLAGLAVAAWLLSKPRRMLWPWALVTGIFLTAALMFAYQKPAALIALMFLVGQVLLSALIVMVLIGITTSTGKTQRSGVWIANGIGMVLFLVLILAYYAVYDISLPYSNTALEPIAGGIIAACAICALIFRQQEIKVDPKLWLAPIFALILLVLPLAGAITWRAPAAVTGQGFPIRIMTYNLHNGFNAKGKLNMEEIAQVIERNNPDIVALQEVSRGWVVSGRVDMLAWLSQRLHMPYVFDPTADPFWGNAILSRYPILAYSRHDLPPRDLFILRGFIAALIDLGNGQQIKVINTHFHHLEGQTDIRQLQSQTILDFLTGLSSTILLGDLNAEPTDREIAMLFRANLRDAAAKMDPKLAYTFASDNPHQRIDYIWVSYDLRVGDVQVPLSTVSDHLPIVAEISK